MTTYKNRYGDKFTFTKDDNHDILWEGNFEYCRFGMPNDYTKAYNAFVADGGKFSFNEFKKAVFMLSSNCCNILFSSSFNLT